MPMDEDAAAPPPKARAPRRDANKERIAALKAHIEELMKAQTRVVVRFGR